MNLLKNPSILLFILSGCILHLSAFAQKSVNALRVSETIKIDGKLSEAEWKKAAIATAFVQNSPKPGQPSAFRTEVRILYDNSAVYIGAKMFDVSADSILQELTSRDRAGLADAFGVYIDTYDNDQDAFQFMVTASGVQIDARWTPMGQSTNWNAAWRSETRVDGKNWYAEIEIPYSAIRFPKTPVQKWGVNFFRSIRRLNEYSYWNPVVPGVNGFVNQFGQLNGIANIQPPIRLQASPYLSSYVNRASASGDTPASTAYSINYGMDLRYGISDAFTLDMILVPDFGQVVSDRQVLNLSPFEVYFDENRQFFLEGTELFNKGGFFYSRRIGGRPIDRGRVGSQLLEGETIVSNPTETSLINASKVSGRTAKGLGLGVFNALTAASYATVQNEAGEKRKIMTNPLANYNIVSVDQTFRNNSYITLINTNVTRASGGYDANVSGLDFNLVDKANAYSVSGRAGVSHQYGYTNGEESETGYMSSLTMSKVSGKFRFDLTNYIESDTYDPNDMGFLRANNEFRNSASIGYYQFEPKGHILRMSTRINVTHRQLYTPRTFTDMQVSGNMNMTFDNFFSTGWGINFVPVPEKDFFEPRVAGRYFTIPASRSMSYWFSTDSRKRFKLDGNLGLGATDFFDSNGFYLGISPRYRVNNKLTFTASVNTSKQNQNIGYVSNPETDINFGMRDIRTITNVVTTKYTFNNRMDLFFQMRHYWSQAEYEKYFVLGQKGEMMASDYTGEHNRDFSAFNIDMIYTWTFAPASEISIVWKNAILNDTNELSQIGYFDQFTRTFDMPQNNSISVRMLYLLDYSMLMKAKRNRDQRLLLSPSSTI